MRVALVAALLLAAGLVWFELSTGWLGHYNACMKREGWFQAAHCKQVAWKAILP